MAYINAFYKGEDDALQLITPFFTGQHHAQLRRVKKLLHRFVSFTSSTIKNMRKNHNAV
jgi:hypothetical protein